MDGFLKPCKSGNVAITISIGEGEGRFSYLKSSFKMLEVRRKTYYLVGQPASLPNLTVQAKSGPRIEMDTAWLGRLTLSQLSDMLNTNLEVFL